MKRIPVWDLPVRVFHWLLVAGIVFAVVSGKIGGNLIEWHGRAGLFILGLVTFRLVWGFVGSRTARFSSFVRGPAAIRAYLRGTWVGIGHNPLGALSVLALLATVALQAGTGLFANDDIAFQGPLADLVGKDGSDFLSHAHHLLVKGLYGLVALHVGAVIFYLRIKRQDILRPMLSGWKEGEEAGEGDPPGGLRRLAAFLLAVTIAAGVVFVASGGLLSPAVPTGSQANW